MDTNSFFMPFLDSSRESVQSNNHGMLNCSGGGKMEIQCLLQLEITLQETQLCGVHSGSGQSQKKKQQWGTIKRLSDICLENLSDCPSQCLSYSLAQAQRVGLHLKCSLYSTIRIAHYLHEKHVLVTVVAQHVIVNLGNNPVAVLPVEAPNVGGVYFVLVLDRVDEAVDGGRDEVERGVDVLGLLSHVHHDPFRGGRHHPRPLGFCKQNVLAWRGLSLPLAAPATESE